MRVNLETYTFLGGNPLFLKRQKNETCYLSILVVKKPNSFHIEVKFRKYLLLQTNLFWPSFSDTTTIEDFFLIITFQSFHQFLVSTGKSDFISKFGIILQYSFVKYVTNRVIQSFTTFQSSRVILIRANHWNTMKWKISFENFWFGWEWQMFVNVIVITSMENCNSEFMIDTRLVFILCDFLIKRFFGFWFLTDATY